MPESLLLVHAHNYLHELTKRPKFENPPKPFLLQPRWVFVKAGRRKSSPLISTHLPRTMFTKSKANAKNYQNGMF